ncbi:hypothetical protein AYI70_g11370 [Smittium culicis]|uniref:Uncharacterized protein n=1 Tax=Smittium culicis TaxID=133412 RepID=A0A1R1X287_9FUNG|nr:hypothetical protein AYI70_g11370 [Smittium culicis]
MTKNIIYILMFPKSMSDSSRSPIDAFKYFFPIPSELNICLQITSSAPHLSICPSTGFPLSLAYNTGASSSKSGFLLYLITWSWLNDILLWNIRNCSSTSTFESSSVSASPVFAGTIAIFVYKINQS